MNYMPSEMVTVPKIAKSSPDTPTAKLAYITPEEQDILIDLNLYGSLDGKPNRGPGGYAPTKGQYASTSPDRFVEIKDKQIDAAKDFRELQKFKSNLNKPNFTPGIAASLLTKVFPGNLDYRREFLARNPQLLEYFNSLSEEDQKSNATMVALADIMNLDGKTYEDFLAYDKGAPGLLYSGDVGGLIKIKNPDGTFRYERRSDDGGGDGIMSDYERRLLELENQLKNQQAAAPTTTTNPFAFRFLADGGRAAFRIGSDSDICRAPADRKSVV